MRRFREDVRDISMWKRCTRKPDAFWVSYSTTHAVYHNPHDSSNTVARYHTPILVRDSADAYWTETTKELQENYLLPDGKKIDGEFIRQLRDGEFYEVHPKSDIEYWTFHVKLEDYGWDCPYGANATNLPHGDGDYLVCKGISKPDLRTVKVVHNAMYNWLYKTKEE